MCVGGCREKLRSLYHCKKLSQCALAAIIKYHRLCGLDNRHLLPTVQEAEKSQVKVWSSSVPSWLGNGHCVTVSPNGLFPVSERVFRCLCLFF